jgi:hypothetical protein
LWWVLVWLWELLFVACIITSLYCDTVQYHSLLYRQHSECSYLWQKYIVICVSVTMRVVNCRLYYKQFVLWYSSLPKFNLHAALFCRMAFSFCVKILQVTLNHVILCEHFTTVAFDICFTMIYCRILVEFGN